MSAVLKRDGISMHGVARPLSLGDPMEAFSHGTATLHAFPRLGRTESPLDGWRVVYERLQQIANLPDGWDGEKGAAPERHTVAFVAQEIASLQAAGLPAPTLNPSANGAIYAEWHMHGFDIEVIFDGPYEITTLIEDARGAIPPFEDSDPMMMEARKALLALASREQAGRPVR